MRHVFKFRLSHLLAVLALGLHFPGFLVGWPPFGSSQWEALESDWEVGGGETPVCFFPSFSDSGGFANSFKVPVSIRWPWPQGSRNTTSSLRPSSLGAGHLSAIASLVASLSLPPPRPCHQFPASIAPCCQYLKSFLTSWLDLNWDTS